MKIPFVSVDPAMRSGQPTINGTRLPVDAIACAVWGEGVDVAIDGYGLTRADVLVACWYAGSYGLPGQRKSLFPVRLWLKRWGAWAAGVHQALWSVSNVDYDAVPDPPTQSDTPSISLHEGTGQHEIPTPSEAVNADESRSQ